jgi:hypothetical protein
MSRDIVRPSIALSFITMATTILSLSSQLLIAKLFGTFLSGAENTASKLADDGGNPP